MACSFRNAWTSGDQELHPHDGLAHLVDGEPLEHQQLGLGVEGTSRELEHLAVDAELQKARRAPRE
jgi:hypothetical protein